MTRRHSKRLGNPAPECTDSLLVYDAAGGGGHDRLVTITFTDEQIAYLDARMAAAYRIRPMGPVGGSHLRCRVTESPHTR